MSRSAYTLTRPQKRPCDVLIVEDDPGLRRAVAQTLQDEGYRVVGARDGLDALDALEGVSPWLILLDIQLPVMSGSELANELKNRGVRAKIMVMTAGTDADYWASAIDAEAYLSKPFELEELLDAVAQLRPRP